MIKIAVYSLKGGVGKTITAATWGICTQPIEQKNSKGRKRNNLRRVS